MISNQTSQKEEPSAKDKLLLRRLFYNLYGTASTHDPEKGLDGKVDPEEDLLIRYISSQITTWINPRSLDMIKENVGSSKKDRPQKDYQGIFQDLTKISDDDMGTLDYDPKIHNPIVDMVDKYFGTFKPRSRFDAESELSRMIFRNFAFECYKSGSDIDDFERLSLERIGKRFFGYESNDVSRLIDEMHDENALMKHCSKNTSELKAEGREGLEKAVQDRANLFVRFVKYALANNTVTNQEDALLREIGMHLGLREEETYQDLINHARKEIEADKKNKSVRILVINHDSYFTNAIRGRLKDSVYDVRFESMEKISSEKRLFESIDPHMVFVDPKHEKGIAMIKIIKKRYPDVNIYALASRGKLEAGTEQQRAEEIGVKGYYHVHKMFPDVIKELKRFYADRG